MSLTAWIIYILMTTLATLSCAMIGMIFWNLCKESNEC